jgi:hypothetical protein
MVTDLPHRVPRVRGVTASLRMCFIQHTGVVVVTRLVRRQPSPVCAYAGGFAERALAAHAALLQPPAHDTTTEHDDTVDVSVTMPAIITLTRRALPSVMVWVWWALAIIGAGCAQERGPKGEDIAKQKADAIFKAIQQKDFAGAAALYSKVFYRVTTSQRWQGQLEEVHRNYGNPVQVTLRKVIVNSGYSGTRIILKDKNHYTEHDAFETLVFDDQINAFGINIVTHQIDMVPEG